MTDEDLIGYIVGALDADHAVAVESHLREHPGAARRVERLRLLLAPLEAERLPGPAPAGLAERTVNRLAAHLAAREPLATPARRTLTRAPREEPETRAVGGRFRLDVVIACGIVLVVGGLVFSTIGKVRARNEMLACQNTLRVTHAGLAGYADTQNGRYPQIAPGATAESFAAALKPHVPVNFRPACPACPAPSNYTYHLGYRAPAGELVGMCRPAVTAPEPSDLVPISADYPLAGTSPAEGPLCPHTGGLNVLFAGGYVRTSTSVLIGPNGDHIFQNLFGAVGAGVNREDVVLGRPGDRP
jgi:prepilin-type processing-associated H-X9-DG protein